jgi:glutathionyl-hydroquinone reductase
VQTRGGEDAAMSACGGVFVPKTVTQDDEITRIFTNILHGVTRRGFALGTENYTKKTTTTFVTIHRADYACSNLSFSYIRILGIIFEKCLSSKKMKL